MAETPDADLPVFSFRPNWKGGVRERLEWLTDVLTSETAAEQRRALRLSPRRSFEFDLLKPDSERTFLDLMLRQHGGGDWMLPLWHDVAKLTQVVAAGGSVLMMDTTNHEFEVGGLVFIGGGDAFTFEVAEVQTVVDGALTLQDPVTNTWEVGTPVRPLRRARLADQPELKLPTSRVADSTMQWILRSENDWAGTAELTMYAGLPVLEVRPEESEPIAVRLVRLMDEAGCDTGIPFFADAAERAMSSQSHRWRSYGRAQHAALRDLLYTLEGRRNPIWIPTFANDMVLVTTAAAGAVELDVEKVGLALSEVPFPGREHIRIERRSGPAIHCKIIALDAAPSPAVERLVLDTALPIELTPADVKRISFMDVFRLDQDAIDILHFTDTNGAAEAAAVFRSFPNTRTASEDNSGDHEPVESPGGEDPGGEDPGGEDPGGEDPGGEPGGTPTSAVLAEDFIGRLGVNTHFNFGGSPYISNPTAAADALDYIGIHRCRDALPYSYQRAPYLTVAARGNRFDFIGGIYGVSRTTAEVVTLAKEFLTAAGAGKIASLESANEVNIWPLTYGGGSGVSNQLAWNQALWNAWNADATTAPIPFLAMSLAVNSLEAGLAPYGNFEAYCDFGTSHPYPNYGHQPAYTGGPGYSWDVQVEWSQNQNFPTKNIAVTECGYRLQAGNVQRVDENTQAKLTLNMILSLVRRTDIEYLFIYQLAESTGENFGLYTDAWAPRKVAHALHNFTSLLLDSGTPMADPGYSIAGHNADGKGYYATFARPDGSKCIVVWAEPDIWNESSFTPVAATPRSVTITFDVAQDWELYDPMVGTSPTLSASGSGTTATFNVVDHPLVLVVA